MNSYLRNRYQRIIINAHSNSNGYHSKWKEVRHGVPQGSVLGLILFLIYINDLSKSVSDKSSPIFFADDTSFIIANRNKSAFKFKNNKIFNEINKWFHSNLLMLNYDKTYFLQFLTKTDNGTNMQVSFGNRKIVTAQSLTFLGLTVDITLIWKYHIGELTSRLNKACYDIRSIKPFMSLDVLRITYFLYAHSIISYGIIFCVNSSYSEDIFKIQKIIIRIIMNSSRNTSCQQIFNDLNIVPIQSQYIYLLLYYFYLLLKIKTSFCLTHQYIKSIQG